MKTHFLVYEYESYKEGNCGLSSINIIVTQCWDKVTCLSCLDLKEKVEEQKKKAGK